jgi:ABC-type sulfate/molybdate transport systems ATPase subunit
MSAALRAEDLHVVRESRTGRFTLSVDRLDLLPGEVLAVLGRNGAGKSTLLRVLAGLEAPARGRVVRLASGPVTLVFQRPIAFAGTVEHNVRIALRARRVPDADARRRVDAALGHFGIAELARRRASRLSGGELRRLALARAFALEPAVLLLDEPFDDLDIDAQEALTRDLRQAVSITGVAVAVVTHDLRRAARVCDRIAALDAGALRQTGSRDEVLDRPCSVAVARLVGMTNLVPAVIASDGAAQVDADHRIPVRADSAPGTPVWVGLRPEHLKVDVGRGEGESIGKATVDACGDDGVVTTLDLRWAGHRLRTHLVAGRGLARHVAVGDAVSLSVRPEDVHLLPRDDAHAGPRPPRSESF